MCECVVDSNATVKEQARRIPDVEKEIDDVESDDVRQSAWMEALESLWSNFKWHVSHRGFEENY